MRVTFRPTVAGDVAALTDKPVPYRIQAITALAGDRILGVGGLGFPPDGTVIAFVTMSDEAKQYPAAIHRAGLMAMAMIRRSGVALVVAEAQPGNPAAERWLERLGFERFDVNERKAFKWQR